VRPRPVEQKRTVRYLAEAGLSASDIAYVASIPRSTVRGWLRPPSAGPPPSARPSNSCGRCGHEAHNFDALPESEYAYLLGFYLGDGTISPGRRGVFALRIVCDSRYRAVLAECALAMAVVMPKNRIWFVRKVGCLEIVSTSKSWPCLLPQHGPARKHERRIALTDWQTAIIDGRPQQFIRGLLHSDGCRITNFATTRDGRGYYEYPRYFFTNASGDIRELLCRSLRQIGVRYTQPKSRVISIARARSVRYVDAFVGPKS
jgi:hypothetical protein